MHAALAGFGLHLPAIGRFAAAGGLLLARIAPHQLLAMRQGVDLPLMQELAPLAAMASLIDWSDSRAGLRLSGPGARAHLATLVPIDLDGFGPGQCAQTLAAHMNVLLLQLAPESYELHCGRSFRDSLASAVAFAEGEAGAPPRARWV